MEEAPQKIAQPVEQKCYHLWKQTPQTKLGYKMVAKCSLCNEVKPDIFPATTFEGFIRRWIAKKMTEKVGKKEITQTSCGNYRATDTKLAYWGSGRDVSIGEDVLAIKLPDGRFIGNASKLPRCGSYRRSADSPAQRIMQELEIPLIPFNVFEEAHLDLRTAKIIEQGKAEELYVPKMSWNRVTGQFRFMDIWDDKEAQTPPPKTAKIRKLHKEQVYNQKRDLVDGYSWEQLIEGNLENRHFIGAMVIEVSNKYYLFDVDRRELTFYRFNAFLSELPKPVKTIAQAYDSLIPDKVRQARKEGKAVLRQGEWFFIPATLPKSVPASQSDHKVGEKAPERESFDLTYYLDNLEIKQADIDKRLLAMKPLYHKVHLMRVGDFRDAIKRYINARKRLARENPHKYTIRGELVAKTNRPNNVQKYLALPEGQFVSGEVTHSGREHEPITLRDWYIAVPNTAINSYTIRGAID